MDRSLLPEGSDSEGLRPGWEGLVLGACRYWKAGRLQQPHMLRSVRQEVSDPLTGGNRKHSAGSNLVV